MARTFHHLDMSERVSIQAQLTMGLRAGAIAAGLQRARSTITREMRRNGWQSGLRQGSIAGGYRCEKADRRAHVLAAKPRRRRKLQLGCSRWITLLKHLYRGLSPAQIASTLARMPDPVRLSHETIYTALYAMPKGELRAIILELTRRGHKARKHGCAHKASKSIPDMTLIDQRPSEVAERLVPGHWEGDLIIGKRNLSQVGTLVERTSLYVALVKLSDGKAETVAKGFATILKRFRRQLRLSMTYDQGKEMSRHKTLAKDANIAIYFAHPHSPWERGISENTNGLLRQYLPKGTDLSLFSQRQLDDIAWEINTRPRKTLGWKAPAELFLPEGTFDFVKYWSTIGTNKSRPVLFSNAAIEK